MKKIKAFIMNMFRDELDIQHKLLNLILSAAFAGGLVSLVASILLKIHISSVLVIALLIAVVGFSLWMANVKNKPQIAAFMIVVAANMIIFPVMYFTGGGMMSGMPVWMVLGMIFSWLILKGKLCFIIYTLNALVVVGCFFLEMLYPDLVLPLESRITAYGDMIQSILVVTCIFGLIFKYQTYVYEKQKKAILKANKVKNDFLANMSHEVRTPINVIMGYNEMIMKESRESQTAEYALNVQLAARTLLSQMNDIFDLTVLEKREVVLKKEPYSMTELLQDVLNYPEYCAEKKGLEFYTDIEETIPHLLKGDVSRLTQILDNLLSNAIKYTKEGKIEIRVGWEPMSDTRGFLKVQIKDTGIGMKQEDVAKISESFVRFDGQQTRNIQGIGLGLTIVTKLLHLMDSSLTVDSEFGEGSAFSFSLAQEVVDATPIGTYIGKGRQSLSEQVEDVFEAPDAIVLVVDDNQMNLDLLKGILRPTRMQVDTATNGAEALGLIRKKHYDIIFMDYMMPVMDGLEALQQMRKEKLGEDTPVVVLTANAVGDAREQYLAVGFDDYLSKPIHSRQLFAMIKKYLPEMTSAPVQEKPEEQQKPSKPQGFLEKLSFLDVATGMEYCCNSEAFYKEMLGSYLAADKSEEADKLYQEENWDKYRILVHALKSTSLSIGAVVVSEEAKKLEMAAKEEDIAYIKGNHDRVMKQYRELLHALKNALAEQKPEAVNSTEKQVSDQEHILVVDDDSMNLQVAKKLLGENFRVDCVKSGPMALEFLKKQVPNLILLDLHMPEMNGFEVIIQIKKDPKLQDIPVVFLTADHDRETEIRGFREGALDFITKPFVADIMLQRIKRILELDRLQKDLQHEVKKQTQSAEVRRQKVERLSLQIMLTLAHTIDAKDKYTNGHSVRVAEYAREIAKRVGKSEQVQEDIYYVGLLHDIGKIGIPNTIINKETRLSEEEYEIIKTHTRIGAEILENMTEIPGLSVGAHWHHELYNGEGYPEGLKGEEIPEVARIIGVADAYDAMTSKRSYRDILPQSVAREEIAKGRGTQFDPQFADVLLEMIDEDKEYRMRERNE